MGDRDRCVNIPGTPAPRTFPTWSSTWSSTWSPKWSSKSLSARSCSSSSTAARRAARGAASRVRATTPWTEPDSRFTAHLEAVVFDRPNGAAESTDARIKRIKRMACGYRNRERSGTRSSSKSPDRTSIRGRSQPSRSPEAPQFCCQKSAARNLTSAASAEPRETPDGTFDGGCAFDGDRMCVAGQFPNDRHAPMCRASSAPSTASRRQRRRGRSPTRASPRSSRRS
jgi:hypothetical protein